MAKTSIINLERYTFLPIHAVQVVGRVLPDVFVDTPMGQKQLPLNEEHYPFIFGSVTQTDTHAVKILKTLRKWENEAVDYLIEGWKKTLKPSTL